MLPVSLSPSSSVLKRSRPKVRIGMVLDQPFPSDPRVEREALALVEAGYEVHILCVLHPGDTLTDEAYRGVYIHRVDPNQISIPIPLLKRQTRFLYQGLVRSAIQRFKNIDTVWHTLIHRFVRNCRLHVLHVHGYRLLDTALNITRHYGVALVADLPDHYPAQVQLSMSLKREAAALQERNRLEALETASILRASKVLTATPEARQRLLRKGIHPDLVSTLENTVDLEALQQVNLDLEVIKRFKSNFVLTYIGRLSEPYQGIQTVLEAMAMLKHQIPGMVFIAVGPIRESYRRQLLPLIKELGLQEQVFFVGWQDERTSVSYIDVSDVCIFPHLVNDQTDTTFPEAVYRCQAWKKPVLLGNTQTMQRYAEETGGAMTFPSGDVAVLAELLQMLYNRPDLRREMSLNGHRAVMERYHWAHSAADLIRIYDQLTGQLAPDALKQESSKQDASQKEASPKALSKQPVPGR